MSQVNVVFYVVKCYYVGLRVRVRVIQLVY